MEASHVELGISGRHPGSSEQTYFAGALRYSAVKYGIV